MHIKTKSSIVYEWCSFLTLLAVIFLADSTADQQMIENCRIDPREEIISFAGWILAPVAISNAMLYFSYGAQHHY